MAIRSLFPNLHPLSIGAPFISIFRRGISSNTLSTSLAHDFNEEEDLKTRVLRLIFPRRSATMVLHNWVNEGRKVSIYDLRHISKQLLKRRRYKHALEVLTWMEAQERFQISAADHALRLELIIRVSTLREAEEYFANLPNVTTQKAAFLPLLHSYGKERATEKAEALMQKMNSLGFTVSPHPFNTMMKLYMATSQFNKVLSVIQQMKRNKIPKNFLSYNLWMSACAEVSGPSSAEMVYKEMLNDKYVEIGWSSLSTLANIYIKSGLGEKATWALRNAEKKLSNSNHLGYFFLITLYTSMKNKGGVLRLWEACKRVQGKVTCANYMSILLCFVKLGDIKEAEKIFMEWESQCRKYDIRVSNVLLGAYVRNGLMEKAEFLHIRTLERGGCPNYKTWEILMEGWVKNNNMDKAITAIKQGFGMLKDCDWRPSSRLLVSIAEYFEKSSNFEDAKWYLNEIRNLSLASLPVYKSLLRMHVSHQRPCGDILQMMHKDGIDMDDETLNVVQTLQI